MFIGSKQLEQRDGAQWYEKAVTAVCGKHGLFQYGDKAHKDWLLQNGRNTYIWRETGVYIAANSTPGTSHTEIARELLKAYDALRDKAFEERWEGHHLLFLPTDRALSRSADSFLLTEEESRHATFDLNEALSYIAKDGDIYRIGVATPQNESVGYLPARQDFVVAPTREDAERFRRKVKLLDEDYCSLHHCEPEQIPAIRDDLFPEQEKEEEEEDYGR